MHWASGRDMSPVCHRTNTYRQTHSHSHSHLKAPPVHLNFMSLDCERKGNEHGENMQTANKREGNADFHTSSQGTNVIRRNQDSNWGFGPLLRLNEYVLNGSVMSHASFSCDKKLIFPSIIWGFTVIFMLPSLSSRMWLWKALRDNAVGETKQ